MRTILCFARRAFRKSNNLKTKMALTTFIIAVFFVFTCIALMFSFFNSFFFGDEQHDEHTNILFVNTPDSFKVFAEDKFFIPDEDELVFAPYDFLNIYKAMDDSNAFAAVVFPDNFDEDILNGKAVPEVVTYYQTDIHEHKMDFDVFMDEVFNKEYEAFLKDYFQTDSISLDAPYEITENPINNVKYSFMDKTLATIIPLFIFISTIYVAMCTGSNAIAGEKENGTFLGILITPIKRSHIILGNLLGCFLASIIPGIIILLFTCPSISKHQGIVSTPIAIILLLLLLFSFVALVTSLTLLLSTISNSILSAQTAFLPVFLGFLLLAIKCMQSVGEAAYYDYIFPVYGHFYGIGYLVTKGRISNESTGIILPIIACIFVTLLITFIVICINTKLLFMERFTSTSEGITRKQIIRSKKTSALPKIPVDFLFNQLMFPLITLSIFQLIAMVPTAIYYMADENYSDFILSLKDVTTMSEIFDAIGTILAIFLSSPLFLATMGISYILLILTYALKIRIGEHELKPFASMGLNKKKVALNYSIGLIIGFIMLSSVVFFLLITNSARINGVIFKAENILILVFSIFMWITQGAAEEVMFRGYMLKRVESKCGKAFAIFFSSLLFAALHGANIGFTIQAGINLFLVSVFFSLLFYRTNSLWVNCAAHTAWNFCQGTLYGLEVSGSTSNIAIFNTTYMENSKAFLTGGAFGPEGGLGVTIVSIIGIIILLMLARKASSQKEA